MTRSMKPELHRSLMKADQVDSAIQFAQARSGDVERPQNAGLQVIRMERIKKEQVADDWILAKSIDNRPTGSPGTCLKDQFHDSFQPRAMHFHKKLDELPDRNLRTAARHLVEFADQGPALPHLFLEFFFAIHTTPSLRATEREQSPTTDRRNRRKSL